MRNILITDYDGGENQVLFTETFTVEEVTKRLDKKGIDYTEIYEVPDNELQYYLYEPNWLEKKEKQNETIWLWRIH